MAPPKPWELSNNNQSSVLSVVTPDLPTNTISTNEGNAVNKDVSGEQIDNTTNSGYSSQNQYSYGISNYVPAIPTLPAMPYNPGFGGGYYSGGYGSFLSGNILPAEPLLPQGSTFSSTEIKIRNAVNTLSSVMRIVGSIFQMMDSTAYAAWSSVMAVVSVIEQFRLLRSEHLRTWFDLLQRSVKWFLQIMGSNRTPIPISEVNQGGKGLLNGLQTKPKTSTARKFVTEVALPAVAIGASYMMIKAMIGRALISSVPKGRPSKAQYTFSAPGKEYLSFEEGDDIFILEERDHDGWILARDRTGNKGYVPINYLKFVESHQ